MLTLKRPWNFHVFPQTEILYDSIKSNQVGFLLSFSVHGSHMIRSQNKWSTRTFSSNFKSLTFNLKARSSTINHGRTSFQDPGPLPGHPWSCHHITSWALQQGNFCVTGKWQVWPDQIQVDRLLPIIGGWCIQIWIQSSSSDSDNQRYKPRAYLIQEHNTVLSINRTSHVGLTLWKSVVW